MLAYSNKIKDKSKSSTLWGPTIDKRLNKWVKLETHKKSLYCGLIINRFYCPGVYRTYKGYWNEPDCFGGVCHANNAVQPKAAETGSSPGQTTSTPRTEPSETLQPESDFH